MKPESWRAQAACADTESAIWFPEKGDWITSQAAKSLCRTCPVVRECGDYAIEHHILDGVWGAMTPEDRKPLLGLRPRKDSIDHATYRGAKQHYRRGETPCRPCQDAAAAYQRERKAERRSA